MQIDRLPGFVGLVPPPALDRKIIRIILVGYEIYSFIFARLNGSVNKKNNFSENS